MPTIVSMVVISAAPAHSVSVLVVSRLVAIIVLEPIDIVVMQHRIDTEMLHPLPVLLVTFVSGLEHA